MAIITIIRLVDNCASVDRKNVNPNDVIQQIPMFLDRRDELIDPEIIKYVDNPWIQFNDEDDFEEGEIFEDDEVINPGIIFNGEQIVINPIVEFAQQMDAEELFDAVDTAINQSGITDIDYILELIGTNLYGCPCLNCLHFGWDDPENFGRCQNCVRNNDHIIMNNTLKRGTWAWSITKSRDETGVRNQLDDDEYEDCDFPYHRDAGLDDRDYYSDDSEGTFN